LNRAFFFLPGLLPESNPITDTAYGWNKSIKNRKTKIGGRKMFVFDNVETKIKMLATIIFWSGLILGGIWLIISITDYVKYADYLEYSLDIKYTSLASAGQKGLYARSGIISAATLMVSSIISAFVLYGFAQLIENSNIMAQQSRDESLDNLPLL
jgi:hypothetical protein